MTSATFSSLGAPSSADIAAIRGSVPGLALGRTVVAFALLASAVAAYQLAAKSLSSTFSKPVVVGILCVTALIVFAQALAEWVNSKSRKRAQALAVAPAMVQAGYFRVGPYDEHDFAKFYRSDDAHKNLYRWIQSAASLPLFVTGESGCGKTSILDAFVIPKLRSDGWTVLDLRAWQDPAVEFCRALNLEATSDHYVDQLAALTQNVLVVIDQFEECLRSAPLTARFVAFVSNVRKLQTSRIRVAVSLRSDYASVLPELQLGDLRQNENWFYVAKFNRSAAELFFQNSGLRLSAAGVEELVSTACALELDDTRDFVRPITLNVVGYVLAAGRATARSFNASVLVSTFVRQAVSDDGIRQFARPVLENLLGPSGERRQRSVDELAKASKIPPAQVRSVLNGLELNALVRPLDDSRTFWEFSHDFVARAVSRYLGRLKWDIRSVALGYASTAILATSLALLCGWLLWHNSGNKISVVYSSGEGAKPKPTTLTASDVFYYALPLHAPGPIGHRLVTQWYQDAESFPWQIPGGCWMDSGAKLTVNDDGTGIWSSRVQIPVTSSQRALTLQVDLLDETRRTIASMSRAVSVNAKAPAWQAWDIPLRYANTKGEKGYTVFQRARYAYRHALCVATS